MHALTIVTTALAVVQAVTQQAMQAVPPQLPPKPFFTDDAAGWVKLGGMYVGALTTIGYIMVKLAYNNHTARVEKMQTDVDGFGTRVDTVARSQTECSGAVGALSSQLAVLTNTVGTHQRELGEHDAQLKAFANAQQQLQTDIMGAIRESGSAAMAELHQLNVKVARFEERERFGEAMGEIASALRAMANNNQASQQRR